MVPGRDRSSGYVAGVGHAEHDRASLGDAVKLGEFLFSGGAADGESFDLAEPAFTLGFADAVGEVVADLDQPAALSGVGPQDQAAVKPASAAPCSRWTPSSGTV